MKIFALIGGFAMFSFGTILTGTINLIQDAMGLIDATTLFGGVVTVAIIGSVMVTVIKRVRKLAR